MEKKMMCFEVPKETIDKIRQIKEQTGISMSFTIRKALDLYLKNLLNAPDFSQVKNGVDK